MGIDAQWLIQGTVDEYDLEALKNALDERNLLDEDCHLELRKYGAIFWGGTRYYEPGYERGNWPKIYTISRVLLDAFPKCHVYYLPDDYYPDTALANANTEPINEYKLQELWTHYLSHKGMNYHKGKDMNEYEQGYNAAKADITQWLLNNAIIRQQMFGLPGYCYADCDDFSIHTFRELLTTITSREERKDK